MNLPSAAAWLLAPLVTWGALELGAGYYAGTAGKELDERLSHESKCAELRAAFFGECQKTMTRQQCEALYGQARGRLFDGPPEIPFVKELDCSGAAHED